MSTVLKKRRQRDYQNKKFTNPFFKDKRNKKGRQGTSKKSILFILIIILILGFAFWFFYIANTFKIKEIKINGLERVSEEKVINNISEITNKTKFFLKQDNLFLVNTNEISNILKTNYNFAQVDVNKELSGKLIIDISERQYEAIFLEDGNYYYIDKEGYIIDKINELEDVNPKKYAIINNESNDKIKENKVNIDLDYLVFINNFYDEFKQSLNDLEIEKFIVKNRNSGLSAQIINGPILYLNIDNDSSAQVRNLKILRENNLNEEFLKRSYIDLRYGDRLFLD
ncbi:FtsQ-type POTRA domain-containing protein [Patescibacteria group bacterium]|nr:FtsQ-type POTRA domain-containing protein [Patescibacteria group bacterium]